MNFVLPNLPATREELELELLASIERLDNGKGISGKESLRQFRKRLSEQLHE